MAILSVFSRRQIWAHLMRQATGELNLAKGDLQAAVNAADDWIDANQAAYNLALPLPARTVLSPSQKALVLMYVIMRRAAKLNVEGD